MNEHLKEVIADMKRLPFTSEQKEVLEGVFTNGAQQSGVISDKEAERLKADG